MKSWNISLLLLSTLALAGCDSQMKAAGLLGSQAKLSSEGPSQDVPVVYLPPALPPRPPAPQGINMTIVNFRQCSPVNIPGIYNVASPTAASRRPVVRVYSTHSNPEANYQVNPSMPRTIHFQKELARMPDGRFELVGQESFLLQLTAGQAAAISQAQAEGQNIVAAIEDLETTSLYSSSAGLPGHGPVPGNPGAGGGFGFQALTTALPASVAVLQVGTILKSGHMNPGDEECDAEGDPLVIDFSGNGFRTVSPSVRFDLSNAGLLETFGWIAPYSNQGFLALDLNGNGRIDNGSELFSNFTALSATHLATNGFEALKSYDRADRGGNNDRKIDSRDLIFSRLKVWMDRNSNGRTDTEELISLSQTGVVSIDLSYTIDARTDENGNKIIGESTVQMSNGSQKPIADLWFAR